MYENKHKAYEAEGPKVSVRVCASKNPGFPVVHLGGYFNYDRTRGLEDAIKDGEMQHCSGYPFPADGKFHEYEFPESFVKRLVTQAAEIPEQFEVEVIEATPVAAPVPVPPEVVKEMHDDVAAAKAEAASVAKVNSYKVAPVAA
jgi:hypothetical protein